MAIILAVINPRAFTYFREKLGQLGLEFTIPRELPAECRGGDLVVTDNPTEAVRKGDCQVVVVGRTLGEWEKVLGKILAQSVGSRVFREIVAGIDTGERLHALVIVGDGAVIHQAKLEEAPLIETLKNVKKTPHQSMRVRIGAIPSNMEQAVELAWRISLETGLPVELADEKGTSRGKRGRGRSRVRDSDLNAAYIIATQAPTIVHIGAPGERE